MPVAAARKIEFLLRRERLDLDVRLDPLLLTAAQVTRYRLPRIPIKDTEKRKGAFEAANGEGATELDALEAIHPGEIRRLIEAAVDRYREPARDAEAEIEDVADQYRADAGQVAQCIHSQHRDALAALRADFEIVRAEIKAHQDAIREIMQEIENQFRARFGEHVDAINGRISAFHERAETLWKSMADALDQATPELDDWPDADEADESAEQLFQSQRSYLEQIEFYKRHQNKPIARRKRATGSGRRGSP
jgi:hypothetical protein